MGHDRQTFISIGSVCRCHYTSLNCLGPFFGGSLVSAAPINEWPSATVAIQFAADVQPPLSAGFRNAQVGLHNKGAVTHFIKNAKVTLK